MLKVVTWNIARRDDAWRYLIETDADIALLQEAAAPPSDVARHISTDPGPWRTVGAGVSRPWRTAIVNISNRAEVQWLAAKQLGEAIPGEVAVSQPGTLAVAIVKPLHTEPFIVASMYALWEKPHAATRSTWIYADGSAHRVISDLSSLVGRQAGHRILAAGDLNVLHGYGEHGSAYWASRYETIFTRMEAIGLRFIGPQAPGGRVAEPWPLELPASSKNVPTYHTSHQTRATATRQLDFVFASSGFAEALRVRALNDPATWGPSDHCRVEVEIA